MIQFDGGTMNDTTLLAWVITLPTKGSSTGGNRE